MGRNNSLLELFLILTVTTLSLNLIGSLPIRLAQNGTNQSGIINSDTVWTLEGSPYNLIGSLTVQEGAVLSIQAGVTVNLNDQQFWVNGSLILEGSKEQKVALISAINYPFNPNYPDFNIILADKSSCLINNAIINNTKVLSYASLEISNSILNNVEFLMRGESNISNSTITNDNVEGLVVQNNAILSNNVIVGVGVSVGIGASVYSSSIVISHNKITGYTIASPIGSGNRWGILLSAGVNAIISDNFISNYTEACIFVNTASALIERNTIENKISSGRYHYGFGIEVVGASPLIQNNTISESVIGLDVYNYISYNKEIIEAKPTVINNNIYNNTKYNVLVGYPDGFDYQNASNARASDVDASNNWWGTTDSNAISKTIYDFKNSPNLGKVTFIPFLTAFNPQAIPDPNAPVPTMSHNSPISTSTIVFTTVIVVSAVSIAFVFLYGRHRKTISQNKPNV